MSTQQPPQPDAPDGLSRREVAALTESMVVDEYDMRLWNDDEVRVHSGENSQYVVNVRAGSCECSVDLLPRLKSRESHHGISGRAWPYGFKTHTFQASLAW